MRSEIGTGDGSALGRPGAEPFPVQETGPGGGRAAVQSEAQAARPGGCTLCPRACGADRAAGERGFCGMGETPAIARVSFHMWEEPCISGTRGSGTVFFAGCPLGCIYCQNRSIVAGSVIPGGGSDLPLAKKVTDAEMADIFVRLERDGAHNINLVTATHFLPGVIRALRMAKARGLGIPVVYNTSGYECEESLRALSGLVDIYLTDFRYMDPKTAAAYSRAPDYPVAAKTALSEMLRQTPLSFGPDGLMTSGTIVRILLLPGHVKEACSIVSYIHETYGDRLYLSLLRQYTPLPAVMSDPLLRRKVTKREYDRLVQHALSLGVTKAFVQEGAAAEESFIPVFDGRGVEKT